jgi:hypothetical protein
MAATYSPALLCSTIGHEGLNFSVRYGRGLTSLFGMGRGEHPRQNHHKVKGEFTKSLNGTIRLTYWNKLT